MILFFGKLDEKVFAVQTSETFSTENIKKLIWLFGNSPKIEQASIDAFFVGPRAAMITPWSTNAVEITQNMGISGIIRIEEYQSVQETFFAISVSSGSTTVNDFTISFSIWNVIFTEGTPLYINSLFPVL